MALLTVDVGNSRTKVAVCHKNNNALPTCAEFAALNNSEDSGIRALIDRLVTKWEPTQWVIAGSNAKLRDALSKSIPGSTLDPLVVRHFQQVPVEVAVDSPESVGIDRILNALGATILSPSGKAILVDSGTATTVDFVGGGTFHGGAILPGLRLSAMSLSDYTHALPLIDTGQLSLATTSVPGKNTHDAIAAGVMLGQVGAIREIVAEYRKVASDAELLLTGGGAERLVPAFADAIVRPYLSLRAMASLAKPG